MSNVSTNIITGNVGLRYSLYCFPDTGDVEEVEVEEWYLTAIDQMAFVVQLSE